MVTLLFAELHVLNKDCNGSGILTSMCSIDSTTDFLILEFYVILKEKTLNQNLKYNVYRIFICDKRLVLMSVVVCFVVVVLRQVNARNFHQNGTKFGRSMYF